MYISLRSFLSVLVECLAMTSSALQKAGFLSECLWLNHSWSSALGIQVICKIESMKNKWISGLSQAMTFIFYMISKFPANRDTRVSTSLQRSIYSLQSDASLKEGSPSACVKYLTPNCLRWCWTFTLKVSYKKIQLWLQVATAHNNLLFWRM